jgi:hypothetical protein
MNGFLKRAPPSVSAPLLCLSLYLAIPIVGTVPESGIACLLHQEKKVISDDSRLTEWMFDSMIIHTCRPAVRVREDLDGSASVVVEGPCDCLIHGIPHCSANGRSTRAKGHHGERIFAWQNESISHIHPLQQISQVPGLDL